MKTMKHLLISVMLVVMLASVGVFAACQPSTPGGDSSSGGEQVQEYGEQGDYYCNAEGNEYQLTLGKGILTMAMQTEMAGTYAYDGETMTVTIGGQTVSAQLQNNILTFTYGGEQLTWYKKVNYTVTFETNGGSAVAAQQVMNGKTFAKPADPTKPEYNFITWYTDEALTKAYAFGTAPVTGDMTLYARFEPAVEGQEEFMATLMAEGQEVAQMQTIGGVLYELPVAEKEGATFAGWWMSVDGDTDKLVCKYEGQTLSQHTTLVAVYSDNAVLVSVNENGAINWTAPGVNNQYVLEIYNNQNGEMVNTVSGGTTKYNYDFNKLPAGEYKVIVKVAGTDLAGTVFFENKVLDKVCLFEVKDGVLMFNAVENAQEYLITIDCGDENHNHVEISNGSSTTYNFANCQMQEDGIIFIVKAVAENFIASSSVPYAFEQSLAAVEGLTVTQEGMLVWNAVENATAYVVEINGKAVNVGNVTEYSIANLAAGQVSIKVQAVAKAYNAGAAAELGYEKEAMAAPANVAVNGNALTWDAVAGAVSYNVMVGDKVYNVTGTTFAITAEHFAEGQELQVKVQAVAENQAQNSYYGAAVNVSNVQTVQQVNYQSGVATWNYVMGATAYLVKVNDGEEMTVTTNSAAVVLTKEGVNVISVCGMKDGAQLGEWAAANVTAYSVTFNTLGGSEVATQYYAVGDKINLPESTLDGYTIGGWYNAEGGAGANAGKFEETVFNTAENLQLYASWNPNKYTATLMSNGETFGSVEVGYKQNYSAPIPTNEDPIKAFGGWYTEPNGQGFMYADAEGRSTEGWSYLGDRNLYASWLDVFTFDLINDGKAYSVSKGAGISFVNKVTVPVSYNDLPITTIESGAFASCSTLHEVNIPNTIQSVVFGVAGGNGTGSAFQSCSNLQNVNVYVVEGNHDVFYFSQDGVLYYNNPFNGLELRYVPYAKQTELHIAFGTQVLPTSVLRSSSVTKVYIPATVTTIDTQAFYMSYDLTEVVFEEMPEGAVDAEGNPLEEQPLVVNSKAFQSCTALTDITFPSRLSTFNADLFTSCKALVNVNVQQAEGAKYQSIDGVLCMNEENVNGLVLVYYPLGRLNETYEIPSQVRVIGESAFQSCTNLTYIEIPSYITEIRKNAFKSCTSLEDVIFQGDEIDSPLDIRESAFQGCSALTEIVISENVRTIENMAFYCTKLVKVTLNSMYIDEANGGSISNYAFAPSATSTTRYVEELYVGKLVPGFAINAVFGSTKLARVDVDDENTNYKSVDGVLYNSDITAVLYYPDGRTGSYDLPATIKVIEDNVFKGKTNITEIIINKNVTYIGESAFQNCTGLTKVTFEEGGTEDLVIAKSAFQGCSKLAEVILPVRTKTIGETAFSGAKFSQIVVPEGVTEIGRLVFGANTSLEKVILPSTLEKVGTYTYTSTTTDITEFYVQIVTSSSSSSYKFTGYEVAENNPHFASINGILYAKNEEGVVTELLHCPQSAKGVIDIPSTVTKVWARAFQYCDEIETFTFNNGIDGELVFDVYAFYYCKGLNKLALPEGVSSINAYTFYYCEGIKELTIPSTVSNIGLNAFYYCRALEKITFADGETPLSFEEGSEVYDNYGTATIYNPFRYCDSLLEVNLPNRTTSVGKYLFAGLANLQKVTLPASITAIGDGTFKGCTSLSQIIIPAEAKITEIGAYAFYQAPITELVLPATLEKTGNYAFGYTAISKVEIPASVTEMGNYPFYYCNNLKEITFAEGCKLEDMHHFLYYAKGIESITLPASIKNLGDYSFYYASALKEVIIPEGAVIESIGNYAFGYSGIQSFKIPASVQTMGYNVFYSCAALTSVTFEEGSVLKSIGNMAFSGTGITTFAFPESTSTITYGTKLFNNSKALTSIYISGSIASVDGLFDGATGLTQVTIAEGHPNLKAHPTLPMITNIDETAIQFIYGELSGDVFVVPEGVERIGEKAFAGQKFETLYLPKTLRVIDDYAFQACSNLKNVIIAEGSALESIGKYAFNKSSKLESINLQEGLKTIDTYAFEDCSSLTSINLPGTLTTLGQYSFRRSGLESVTIPKDLKLTATYIFTGSNLKEVTFEEGNATASLPNYTFDACASLESITLPTSVKTIGTNAFRKCASLKSIVLHDGITKLDNYSFSESGLESIEIPDTVTSFGTYVFSKAENLASVKLPDNKSLKSLGNYMFQNCTSLKSIELPNTLNFLGTQTFRGSGLEEIVIPQSVTCFGTSATSATATSTTYLFAECANLKKVVLHDKFTAIGQYTFQDCTALSDINLPDSLTLIGGYAFNRCSSLTSVNLGPKITNIATYAFQESGLTSVKLPKLTTAGTYIFKGCASLESVDLTNNPKLGTYMFQNCTALKEIDFTGYTALTTYICDGCTSLENVKLNPNMTAISNYSFRGCTSLKKITLPTKLTNIGTYTFQNSGLEEITIPDTVKVFGSNATTCNETTSSYVFDGCVNLKKVTLSANLTGIGGYAFRGCTSLKTIDFPSTLTLIGKYAFSESGLEVVSIPAKVTVIGDAAFAACANNELFYVDSNNTYYTVNVDGGLVETATNLIMAYPNNAPKTITIGVGEAFAPYTLDGDTNVEKVIIEEGITAIPANAFYGAVALKEVVIPESVTSIGTGAFRYSGIESIEIPEGVTTLPTYVFGNCENLKSVTLHGGLTLITDMFYQCTALESIEIPEGITAIPNYTFDGCTALKSVKLPSTLETIGTYAFRNTGLESFTVTANIVSVGNYAFTGSAVKELTIESRETTLGTYLLKDCVQLTKVNFPADMAVIPNYIFTGCTALETVELPETITTLGTYMFQNCTSLKSFVVPKLVTLIPASCFQGCTALESVILHDDVVTINGNAFTDATAIKKLVIPMNADLMGNIFKNWTAEQTIYFRCDEDFAIATFASTWNGTCEANIVWGYKGE